MGLLVQTFTVKASALHNTIKELLRHGNEGTYDLETVREKFKNTGVAIHIRVIVTTLMFCNEGHFHSSDACVTLL